MPPWQVVGGVNNGVRSTGSLDGGCRDTRVALTRACVPLALAALGRSSPTTRATGAATAIPRTTRRLIKPVWPNRLQPPSLIKNKT